MPQRDWASIAVEYAQVMGWPGGGKIAATEDDTAEAVEAETEQTFWNDVLGLPYAIDTRAQVAHLATQSDLRGRANNPLGDPAVVAAIGQEADYLRNTLSALRDIDADRLTAAESIASAYRQIAGETANLASLTERTADSAYYWPKPCARSRRK